MSDKQQMLTSLHLEFKRWEALLASLSEAQITAPQLAANWSVKDVIAHLWAWQQRSIARLEAGLHDREPDYPHWPAEFDPEVEGEPDQLNAWLYKTNRDKSWPQVYEEWQTGFRRFLALGEALPEQDLVLSARYEWMEGYPLLSTLQASSEHYTEHREWLVPQLQQAISAQRGSNQ
jgi:hypothetical protein